MRSLGIRLRLLCVTVVSVSFLVAECPARSESEGGDAQDLFQLGVRSTKEDRWSDAREYFERSRALDERPSTVFNLGIVLRHLGREEEAIEVLLRFLEIAEGDRFANARLEAKREIAEAKSALEQRRARGEGLESSEPKPPSPDLVGSDPPPNISSGSPIASSSAPGAATSSVAPPPVDRELQGEEAPPTARAAPRTGLEAGDERDEADFVPWLIGGALVLLAAVIVGVATTSGERDPYAGSADLVVRGLERW